ncbi:TolB family protein [Methanolobus profundi]|uniref:WD40-like Beta Propeller Repeat n=1 Tax=Methanolobus profundi TaxID=487685 RepID=A0A1I4REE1_9EURY|nr:PD40 domain-containing protein [Methanolobus profundi]SFM50283.1 WD40-like Beta Propeller Repeat [Methanolobus profundi]
MNKLVISTLILITLCSMSQSTAANEELEINITAIADLNQTIGKDVMSLVDSNGLIIDNAPLFTTLWSLDEKHMLIYVYMSAHQKSKGAFRGSGIYALYITNVNCSEITRVNWKEYTSADGSTISSPEWSFSGDYFSYLEITNTAKVSSTQSSSTLYVMSENLDIIRKINCDPEKIKKWKNKWSPKEDKISFIEQSTNLSIYDVNDNCSLRFDLHDDYTYLDDGAWSPDGSKISFTKDQNEIIILDIEKKGLNTIYSTSTAGMVNGKQWSPDSKKLFFYAITGSEKEGTLLYDIYVMEEYTKSPLKVISYKSPSSAIFQWYPDSENLLLMHHNPDSNSYKLDSLSDSGSTKELFTCNQHLYASIGPNDYILATNSNPTLNRIENHFHAYDLFLFNDLKEFCFENITYYTWKDDNLLFVSEGKMKIFEPDSEQILETPIVTKEFETIRLSPSGDFIFLGSTIMGFQKQEDHTDYNMNISSTPEVIIKNPENEPDPTKTTAEKKSTGFSRNTCFLIIGIAIIFSWIIIKLTFNKYIKR